MEVRNKKWTEQELFQKRQEVLSKWPTASDIHLEEAIEYRKGLSDTKKLVNAIAKKDGQILVGAHIGHATVEDTLEHFKAVQEAGADYSNLCTDTYSRRGRYAEAESTLQESMRQGKSLLNGFPIVNHGLDKARYIRDNIDIPILLVDGEFEDCALLTEMGLAAGFEHVSSGIESVLRASKDYPLEQKIIDSQYMDRLAGYYTERGAPVQVKVLGHLCGLDPPGIKVALAVLNSLLAVEQGVKHIGLSLSLTCHLIQDVAAIRLAKEMTKEYLKRFNYEAVVTSACFQFLGPWPRDQLSAFAVSALNSAIPILAGIDWFTVKSVAEAIGIPPKEANVAAVKIAKKLIDTVGRQGFDESEELKVEKGMIALEAKAIIEKTLELGDGDPAVGEIKAVESGVIDMQFSPCRRVRGLVFPLRDNKGAIRYLRHGNIPLPKEVIEYHQECIAKRQRKEQKATARMMIDDVGYLSGGLT